jgi:hypothetical protein
VRQTIDSAHVGAAKCVDILVTNCHYGDEMKDDGVG